MNVLIVNPYSYFGVHFAVDLEIAERHILSGDKVIYLICNGELQTCLANASHGIERCIWCKSQRITTLKRFPHKMHKIVSFSDLLSQSEMNKVRKVREHFRRRDELTQYYIDNYDIGYEALSTVISLTRNPNPDVHELSDLIKRCLISGAIGYYATLRAIEQYQIELVYLFNGRIVPMRGVRRAVESKKLPYYTHERAHDMTRFALFENTTPHDFDYMLEKIEGCWKQETDTERKIKLAEQFYIEKSSGREAFNYIKNQEPGLLPANWSPNKKKIGVFLTSEDEFEAVGEKVKLSIYDNQFDGLKKIIDTLNQLDHNIHFYVRCHPNMLDSQASIFQSLENDFVTVIKPKDKVSTYTLLQNCAAVLTFGSTVGIEAVYYGVPSILIAGKAMYEKLGGTYQPKSHEELVSMLMSDLLPMDKTPAYKYGYYMKTYGILYKHYIPKDAGNGYLYGRLIQPNGILVNLRRVYTRLKSITEQ